MRKYRKLHFTRFSFIICLFFIVCTPASYSNNTKIPGYDISQPDTILILPDILHEISGLTNIDQNSFACIQDENGILFIYDIVDNKITKQYNFHIDGDYEGITRVENSIYILRSDGTLFEISDYRATDFKLRSFSTGIPASNNEGLCYDAGNHRLLIACKSKPGKGPEYKDKRVVYGFDLKSKQISDEPVFNFNVNEIKAFAQEKKLNVIARTKKKGETTAPLIKYLMSAIAIHPFTQKLYVLSAVDHMLFIFDSGGTLEHIELLNAEMFNKAEGITFTANGDLLITNEGQNKKPTLLRFNFLNQ
ncbi:MAG TPA: SdiA-regulated domain-containing protein [Bacteroidia bacterium]|nr:SdiA-regulated domain-containing protein [Bacteroidia bacterium]